jgi:isopenicillin N synthase-like dioxygenase
MTPDKLKSTLHRVTLPPLQDRYTGQDRMTRARYSIPYFVAPDPDTVVECFPTCQDPDHPALYEPITQEAYCVMRATAHYSKAEEERAEA